jgi:recombination protein RecA
MAKNSDRVALEDALKVMKKSFGPAFDERGVAEDCYEAIPTGYDDLDSVATNGARGIYLGGIVEVFGPEGGGKTSFAMKVVAAAQRQGLNCVWIDAEAGFSPDLAEINGVDLKRLIMPDLADIKRKEQSAAIPHAGEILDLIYQTISTGAFGVVVLDSIAGLSPQRVLAADYDPNKRGMGEVPGQIGEQINKIHHACHDNRCSLIAINQLRMKIGDQWNPEDTPGGRAVKFFADQRIRIDRIGGEKGRVEAKFQDEVTGDEVTKVVGHYARLKIIKNKKAPPCDAVEIPVYYCKYDPDNAKKLFDIARDLQVITIRQGVYTWRQDGAIILKENSEPEMLAAIRGAQMEPQLAAACVQAEQEDKNISKKEPVRVPLTLRELAETYKPDAKVETTPDKKKKSKKASLDLEE